MCFFAWRHANSGGRGRTPLGHHGGVGRPPMEGGASLLLEARPTYHRVWWNLVWPWVGLFASFVGSWIHVSWIWGVERKHTLHPRVKNNSGVFPMDHGQFRRLVSPIGGWATPLGGSHWPISHHFLYVCIKYFMDMWNLLLDKIYLLYAYVPSKRRLLTVFWRCKFMS
jgi:hypothetical protein